MQVRRDLQRSLVQTSVQTRFLLIRWISLIQLSFQYFQGWSFHSVSQQLLPFLDNAHGDKDSPLD